MQLKPFPVTIFSFPNLSLNHFVPLVHLYIHINSLYYYCFPDIETFFCVLLSFLMSSLEFSSTRQKHSGVWVPPGHTMALSLPGQSLSNLVKDCFSKSPKNQYFANYKKQRQIIRKVKFLKTVHKILLCNHN